MDSKQLMSLKKAKPIVQPKLRLNEPGDMYKQETDAIADQIMSMSSNETAKPVTGLIGRSLQRKCEHCEEEGKRRKPVMRKAENGNSGMQVSSSFASILNSTKGGGSPLPQGTKRFMENAFSTDFSNVRIHTNSQASEMSKGINAKAFTHGSDIYFNEGRYNPNSGEGKHLLGHELTHVLQQKPEMVRTNHGLNSTKYSITNSPTIQRWSYGSGAPIEDRWVRFVPVPEAHRNGPNGVKENMNIIDQLSNGDSPTAKICRMFFGPLPKGHCPSGETLKQIHKRSVVWFADIAPDKIWAITERLGSPNIGYTLQLFNLKYPEAFAASILHEYVHVGGEADDKIGDKSKDACGLPNLQN